MHRPVKEAFGASPRQHLYSTVKTQGVGRDSSSHILLVLYIHSTEKKKNKKKTSPSPFQGKEKKKKEDIFFLDIPPSDTFKFTVDVCLKTSVSQSQQGS